MRLVLLLALAAACGSSKPVPTPDALPSPTSSPLLLVANKAPAPLSILELPDGKALATLPTGVGPHEIAVSPDGRRAVVTNYGDQATLGRSLTVVDLAPLTVTATIDLGEYRRPHGIAFLADGKRIVATAEANASVVIVDLDTRTVERGVFTAQQGSHMLALTPDRAKAYVVNIGSGSVTAIDLVAMTGSDPAPVIPACEGIAVARGGTEVWTASLKTNKIVVLDATTLAKTAELEGAGVPIRLTATPDGNSVLVTNAEGSTLQIVDAATRAVQPVTFEARDGQSAVPVGTVVSNDGKTAYVALVAEDRVAVVDLATRTVTGHLPVGHGPDGVAYSDAFAR